MAAVSFAPGTGSQKHEQKHDTALPANEAGGAVTA